jgi:citrate synthase
MSEKSVTDRGLGASGLEDVIAAETRLSDVDGAGGRLIIAGQDVERAAVEDTFEEVAARLLAAARPSAARSSAELAAAIGASRVAAFARLGRVRDALDATDAMVALRGAVAQLDDVEGPALIGAIAVYVAAHARLRVGAAPLPPDPDASHAADLLRMLHDRAPTPAEAAALSAYLVTVSDHGMNASTFAARVVASTGSDRVSAIVAAIGALKGPLHGGAPGPVLDMLDAIGAPERATAWIEAALDAKQRIMGMGHRVYRVRDPRAAVFEGALQRLTASQPRPEIARRLALARAVEQAAERALAARHPDRALRANVEFYTAVLLEALGIDRAHFTAIFAAGRVAGWCAHVDEQQAAGRLIRPASRYVGTRPA